MTFVILFQEFLSTDPIISEYKAKIAMFKKLENSIEDINASEVVGPIELFTGKAFTLIQGQNKKI